MVASLLRDAKVQKAGRNKDTVSKYLVIFLQSLFAHYFVKIFNRSPAMLKNFA